MEIHELLGLNTLTSAKLEKFRAAQLEREKHLVPVKVSDKLTVLVKPGTDPQLVIEKYKTKYNDLI